MLHIVIVTMYCLLYTWIVFYLLKQLYALMSLFSHYLHILIQLLISLRCKTK